MEFQENIRAEYGGSAHPFLHLLCSWPLEGLPRHKNGMFSTRLQALEEGKKQEHCPSDCRCFLSAGNADCS